MLLVGWLAIPPEVEGPPIVEPPVLNVADLSPDNAIYWYRLAAEAFCSSVPGQSAAEITRPLRLALKGSLTRDSVEVILIIERSSHIMSLAEKGFEQPLCLVPTRRRPFEKQRFTYDIRAVCNLLLLRARQNEVSGRLEEAAEDYIKALGISYDTARGGHLFWMSNSISIRQAIFDRFGEAIRSHRFKRPDLLRRIVSELERMQSGQPRLSEFIRYQWLADRGIIDFAYAGGGKPPFLFRSFFGKRRTEIIVDNAFRRLISRSERPFPEILSRTPHRDCGIPESAVGLFFYFLKDGTSKRLLYEMLRLFVRAEQLYMRDYVRGRLLLTSAVLELYRQERGAYPKKLEELSPTFIAELPLDDFSLRPFGYERKGNGYRLWSIGPDLKDDGGKVNLDLPAEGSAGKDMVAEVKG